MTASHQAYPKAEAFLPSPHNVFLKDLFCYCDQAYQVVSSL